MTSENILNAKWEALPGGASYFLKRAVGLFIGWKLLYIFLLLPLEQPDGWLVHSLGEATAFTLNMSHGADLYKVRHIRVVSPEGRPGGELCAQVYRPGNRSDIGIFAPCNGLELMVLAAGFILCFEGGRLRKTAYVLAAVFGIFLVNVIRCSLLAVIKSDHPAWFEFTHKYLFNLSGYAFVFLIWMEFVKGQIGAADRKAEA